MCVGDDDIISLMLFQILQLLLWKEVQLVWVDVNVGGSCLNHETSMTSVVYFDVIDGEWH